jgi:hypothetical protein
MIKLIAEAGGMTAGIIFIFKSIASNFIGDYLESIFKHLFIRSKRHYVIYTHSVKHKDKLPEHDAKLFVCQDPPCDLLHTDKNDLGLHG